MIEFILGLFIGNVSGMLMMALCVVSSEADKEMGRMARDRKGISKSDKHTGREDKPKD